MSYSQEQEEDFTFPITSSSNFIESPRLKWRRVPPTANSTPITRLELLRSKYQRRSFSYMENNSSQMMSMMMMTKTHDQEQDHVNKVERCDDDDDINKMDLLWQDLHEFSNTKKYFDNDDNDDDFDPDRLGIQKRGGDSNLQVRRQHGTMTILKVLKKLFYVRKTGSSRSI